MSNAKQKAAWSLAEKRIPSPPQPWDFVILNDKKLSTLGFVILNEFGFVVLNEFGFVILNEVKDLLLVVRFKQA